jgi:hypothetical protein
VSSRRTAGAAARYDRLPCARPSGRPADGRCARGQLGLASRILPRGGVVPCAGRCVVVRPRPAPRPLPQAGNPGGNRAVTWTAVLAGGQAALRTKNVSCTTSPKPAPAAARHRRRLPGTCRACAAGSRPGQLTALVLRDLAAHHHQPASAGGHLTVAAPGDYPLGSCRVPQHGHPRLSFRWRTPGAAPSPSGHQGPRHGGETR